MQEEDNEENSSNPAGPEPQNLSDSSKNESSENSKGSGLGKSKKVFKENKRFKNFTNETIYRNYRNLSLEFPQNDANKFVLSESMDQKEQETHDDDRMKEKSTGRNSLRDRDIEMFSTAKEKQLLSTKGKNKRFPKPEEFEFFLEGLKEANASDHMTDAQKPAVSKNLSDLAKIEDNFVELGKFNSLESSSPEKEEADQEKEKEKQDSIEIIPGKSDLTRYNPAWSQTPETKPRLEKVGQTREFNPRGGSPILRGRPRESRKRKSLSVMDGTDTRQRLSLPNKFQNTAEQLSFMFGSSKEAAKGELSGRLVHLKDVRNKGMFKTVENLMAKDSNQGSSEQLKQNGKETVKNKATLDLQLSILKKLTNRQPFPGQVKQPTKGTASVLSQSSHGNKKVPLLNFSGIHEDKSKSKQTPLNSDRTHKDTTHSLTTASKPRPDLFKRYLKAGEKPLAHRSFQDSTAQENKRAPGSVLANLISSIKRHQKN